MAALLDFETLIYELESKIQDLNSLNSVDLDISKEVEKLQDKLKKLLKTTYDNLTPWQKVKVSRHPDRPQTLDYMGFLLSQKQFLAGDRNFGEDASIMACFGRLDSHRVMIIGHQKGYDTEGRIRHNFGMPKPEGYRKVERLYRLADKFNLPIICFINSSGAHPGIDAEERGQGEAIARCIETALQIKVPIISVIIGEGFSGGAIAMGVGNRVAMLEHSVYSVISPEACASIIWRSNQYVENAAQSLSLTANIMIEHNIIETVIREPLGGAHRNKEKTMLSVKEYLLKTLRELSGMTNLSQHRHERFLKFS